jgi:hypothetical protein
MSKLDLTNTSAEQGRPFLKSISYSIRILKVSKKSWSRGTDMLVFQNEIVAPETLEGAGKIAGLQLFERLVLDGDSDIPRKKLKALLTMLKLPLTIDPDEDKDLRQFVGKAVRVQLRTKPTPLKNEDGTPVLNDEGLPIVDNNYEIVRYIGADDANTIPAANVAY